MFAASGRGVFWDLCAGSLEQGLEKAVATIKMACEQQPPPANPPPYTPPQNPDAGPPKVIE